MDLLKTILFILASVGVVNGLALTGFLWLKKKKSIAELYFSGLVLTLCMRIGKSIFFYFAEEVDRLILQVGLSACIFIGPFFFLFAKAALQKTKRPSKIDLWLLFILAISITGVGTVFPYRSFPEIWNEKIILGIYLVWLIFVLGGLWILTPLWAKWKEKKAVFTQAEKQIIGVAIGTVFITATYQFAFYIDGITYIWGALIFTAAFYYLLVREILQYINQRKRKSSSPLENQKQLWNRIESVIRVEKLYRNQKFKLDDLAAIIQLNRNIVSKVMNDSYPGGFAKYVNHHRIREAKNLIFQRDDLSLEGIGYEAGFSSKSSFYSVFKEQTGQTPAQFRKSTKTKTDSL